jgi:hypothetical protein
MSPSTPQLPANYRVILDVVNEYGAGRHATAQEVFMRARELRPGIGFTTVHRGLARLHELGHVLKLDITGEGSAMYEPATELPLYGLRGRRRRRLRFRCGHAGRARVAPRSRDP